MSAFGIIVTIFIVILVIFVFKYMFYSQNTLTSMQNAKTESVIAATTLPNNSTGSAPTNFAYSAWIYIDNWNYRYGEPKVILGRMGSQSSSSTSAGIDGIYGANPCPLLALGAIENTVTCALSCFAGPNAQDSGAVSQKTVVHTCSIANVPLQTWVNIVIVVNGETLELYMNGKIVRTCALPGTAFIDSTANIMVTPGGGFEGYTANIQYWAAPMNAQEVWNVYKKEYKGNIFGNLFNTYSVQVSVTENGVTQGSVAL